MNQFKVASITGADVARLDAVVGADDELLTLLQDLVGPARPNQPSVRTLLLALALLAAAGEAFYITGLVEVLARVPGRARRNYVLQRPDGRPFTVRQLDHLFCRLAEKLDPYAPGLLPAERHQRAELLQRLSDTLIAATAPGEWTDQGSIAIDATLCWAWQRAPFQGNAKITRGGMDGDGVPTNIAKVFEGLTHEEAGFLPVDADPFEFADANPNGDVPPAPNGTEDQAPARRRDHKRRDPSVAWVGNKRPEKAVYGHAHHVAVAVPTTDREDVPCIAVGCITTPANLNPAAVGVNLAARYRARRVAVGLPEGVLPLAEVLADPGYSQAKRDNWQLPLKALGASPVWRMHAGTQEGVQRSQVEGLLQIDGRFYCTCLPDHLRAARWRYLPKEKIKRADHQAFIANRVPYEYRPNGRTRANGSRQYLAPHQGGCDYCDHLPAEHRCCTKRSFLLSARQLAWYQDEIFASRRWEFSYARRNRVEGYFGILKSLSGSSLVRDACHLIGYAKVVIATTFRLVAANTHLVDLWRNRQVNGRRARRSKLVSITEYAPQAKALVYADAAARADAEAEPRTNAPAPDGGTGAGTPAPTPELEPPPHPPPEPSPRDRFRRPRLDT